MPGGAFAGRLLAAALAATLATAVGLWLLFRARLRGPRAQRSAPDAGGSRAGGVGALAAAAAAGLTLALAQPALAVLGVGLLAAAVAVARGRLDVVGVVRAVGPGVLGGLFLASVALGVVARVWDGPARLLAGAGRLETAAIGALGAIGLNNLPATVLLSAQAPHPTALLIGLNLGPNLAVTGSLSAYLWFRAARQIGARPQAGAFSRRGVVLAPLGILAALAAAAAFGPSG